MGCSARHHGFWLFSVLVGGAILFSACAPDPTVQLISPDMLSPAELAEAGKVEAVPTEPPRVANIADLTEEEILAGLPPEIMEAMASADPGRGEQLTLLNGCIGCHSLDGSQQLTGPSWVNLANVAITRVEGQSPGLYLYDSVVHPNDYILEGYPANIMPATFGDTLSDQELADMLAFMLTFRGQ
jgi:mono/diheme cytochrome c family protein